MHRTLQPIHILVLGITLGPAAADAQPVAWQPDRVFTTADTAQVSQTPCPAKDYPPTTTTLPLLPMTIEDLNLTILAQDAGGPMSGIRAVVDLVAWVDIGDERVELASTTVRTKRTKADGLGELKFGAVRVFSDEVIGGWEDLGPVLDLRPWRSGLDAIVSFKGKAPPVLLGTSWSMVLGEPIFPH